MAKQRMVRVWHVWGVVQR